jgi:AcrR family transcriptional regulator
MALASLGFEMEPGTSPSRGRVPGSWHWASTAGTRRALLDAAREIFTEQGYASASITELVRRGGSSVGSLYHHFGGKTEVFLALWEEHQAAREHAVSRAVAKARRAGATEPFELFPVAARAFLESSWERRDLEVLFREDDSIPGFSARQRRLGQEWVRQHDALLLLPENSFDSLYAGILASLIDEGAREVVIATSRPHADLIIDAVIEYVRRITVSRPRIVVNGKA